MKPSTSHYPTIRGLAYHVRTWGEPQHPRLFLLHGWMDVSASFQFLVDCFARDWYIVAPDWRGFGETEWARDGYWFPDYYADLDALLDLYGTQTPVNLIGHSMGGNIACTYAGLRPERIARLVSLEGLGLKRSVPESAPKRLAQWLDTLRDPPAFSTYASFGDVVRRLKRNNPRLRDDQAAFLARHWAREKASGGVELRSDPRHKMVNPYSFRIEESIASWRRITAPVLLVSGKDSGIAQRIREAPEDYAERKAAFRNMREVELEDCGHMIHHDQPGRLARLIEEFVARTPHPLNEQSEP